MKGTGAITRSRNNGCQAVRRLILRHGIDKIRKVEHRDVPSHGTRHENVLITVQTGHLRRFELLECIVHHVVDKATGLGICELDGTGGAARHDLETVESQATNRTRRTQVQRVQLATLVQVSNIVHVDDTTAVARDQVIALEFHLVDRRLHIDIVQSGTVHRVDSHVPDANGTIEAPSGKTLLMHHLLIVRDGIHGSLVTIRVALELGVAGQVPQIDTRLPRRTHRRRVQQLQVPNLGAARDTVDGLTGQDIPKDDALVGATTDQESLIVQHIKVQAGDSLLMTRERTDQLLLQRSIITQANTVDIKGFQRSVLACCYRQCMYAILVIKLEFLTV